MTFTLACSFGSVFMTIILLASSFGKLKFTAKERERHLLAIALPQNASPRTVALVLPYAEIILALGLLFGSGLLGIIFHTISLVLFAGYMWFITIRLFGPNPSACPCFGKPRAIGPWTLARNISYVTWSIVGLWGRITTETSPFMVITQEQVSITVLTLGALTTLVTIKSQYPLVEDSGDTQDYLRLPVPAFSGWKQGKGTIDLRKLSSEGPKLLIIGDHRSVDVLMVFKKIPRWRAILPQLEIVPVIRAADPDWQAVVGKHQGSKDPWFTGYLCDSYGQIYSGFGASPEAVMAVLLGADGLLAGGPVVGVKKIETLVDAIATELSSEDTEVT